MVLLQGHERGIREVPPSGCGYPRRELLVVVSEDAILDRETAYVELGRVEISADSLKLFVAQARAERRKQEMRNVARDPAADPSPDLQEEVEVLPHFVGDRDVFQAKRDSDDVLPVAHGVRDLDDAAPKALIEPHARFPSAITRSEGREMLHNVDRT
jgi:hypothetical protein